MSDSQIGSAYLPESWNFSDEPSDGLGGPPPEDPGSIYITDDESENILLKTSLSEIVDDAIDGHIIRYGQNKDKIDPQSVELFKRIKKALKSEIDKIDSFLD